MSHLCPHLPGLLQVLKHFLAHLPRKAKGRLPSGMAQPSSSDDVIATFPTTNLSPPSPSEARLSVTAWLRALHGKDKLEPASLQIYKVYEPRGVTILSLCFRRVTSLRKLLTDQSGSRARGAAGQEGAGHRVCSPTKTSWKGGCSLKAGRRPHPERQKAGLDATPCRLLCAPAPSTEPGTR